MKDWFNRQNSWVKAIVLVSLIVFGIVFVSLSTAVITLVVLDYPWVGAPVVFFILVCVAKIAVDHEENNG